MHEEHEQLDEELGDLAQTLRDGNHMRACSRLAECALKLDLLLRREERALTSAHRELETRAPTAITMTRGEHASLRRLVSMIANALDRADDRRGLDMISKLRSVLLLHVAKEELLLAPPTWHAVH